MGKRIAIIAISAWVLFAGNALPHSPAHRVNNAVVGAGLLFFGGLSIRHEWARFVTLAFAAWLFLFTAFAHSSPATFWNDAMVAFVVSVLSLLGGEGRRVLGGARAFERQTQAEADGRA
jgi:hypothetical protein